MQGKIIKQISNDYTVKTENDIYICKSRGKFRNLNITPLVGDIVEFDALNKYILEVYTRKNELIRPPISNVDQAFIITNVKEPDFSSYLLDKLLVIIEYNSIKPVICFTKLDLLSEEEKKEILKYINYYRELGYSVFENNEIESIKQSFLNKVTVFTGQSGAGKSTLLNKIDSGLKLKTDKISKALGRGKHTTRHTELIEIAGGLVADTPGFSSIDFQKMTRDDIRDQFLEFELYRDQCKYKDCMHDKEDACVIKEKVNEGIINTTRYENYLQFINPKGVK